MRHTNLSKSSRVSTERRSKSRVTDSKIFRAATILSLVVVAVIALMLIRQATTTAQAQKSTEVSEAASLFEANAAAGNQSTKPEITEQTNLDTSSDDSASLSPEGSTCSWTASTVHPVTILDQATVAVGSNLYTFGGVSTAIIANARKFDGTTWTDIAPLPAALEFPTAVTDGTNIFILGGALVGTGTPQTTLYRYNVGTNTYTLLAPFTTGTWNAAAVYLGGKIYKFTGTGPATASTNVLEIYDVVGNTWTPGAAYPLAISFVGAFVKDGFIYGAGGIESVGSLASLKTYRYAPVANTWDDAAVADLPQTRWGAASSITGYGVNNGWVLAGGYVNGTATANISTTVIRWNSTTNVWSNLPNLSVGERARMTGAILGASFYVIGGRSIASAGFVGTNSNQKLTCVSGVAVINAGTATVTSGNNLLEPNECNTLNIPLTNEGDVNATAISAVLSTTTPGITITQPNSAYANIPGPGGPTNNTTPYQVSIDNTVMCFTTANFTLTVTYTGGSSPAVFNFSLPIGIPSVNYVSTTQTGQTIPAGGVLVPGSQVDDGAVAVTLPAGWASTVYGVPVTSLSAGTNGMLTVNGAAATTFTNSALPGAVGGVNPTLFPYWDDFDMDPADTVGGGIYANTIGAAPNRQFYVEWRATHFSEAGTTPTHNMAVLLTEGSDVVRYVYVLTGVGTQLDGLSATIGVQRQQTGTQFTQFSFNTSSVMPGSQITYTRPAGQCTPGTGPCATVPESRADFDGDGKTDLSVFRPSEGNWYLQRSTAGFQVQRWGLAADTLIPGDFDGDGKADAAVFRANADPAQNDFFVLNSNGFTFTGTSWGLPGDVPISGDYDGDNKTDRAVWRPSTRTWFILNSGNGSNTVEPFGLTTDIPLSIDNNGDGKTNLAVYRPSENTWYIAKPTGVPATNFDAYPFGTTGDQQVQADYDGDNKDDIAVFRPSNGTWYILRSTNGMTDIRPFGTMGDVPVPGDYDGDGSDDVAVYRGGTWYVNRSTAGFIIQNFGLGTDIPIPNKYLPAVAGGGVMNYTSTTQTGQTIPAGGTLVPGSTVDDGVIAITLPAGWASTVYGIPVTSLSAGTNGMLTVNGAAATTFTNTALPGAVGGVNPTLFPYWDDFDMDPADTVGGGIFVNTIGTAPNRQFYVEWRATHFSEASTVISTNMAVLLTEGSDVVRYRYALTGVGTQLNGLSSTVGIQRQATGTQNTQFSFNMASLSAGLQITLTR